MISDGESSIIIKPDWISYENIVKKYAERVEKSSSEAFPKIGAKRMSHIS